DGKHARRHVQRQADADRVAPREAPRRRLRLLVPAPERREELLTVHERGDEPERGERKQSIPLTRDKACQRDRAQREPQPPALAILHLIAFDRSFDRAVGSPRDAIAAVDRLDAVAAPRYDRRSVGK